MRILICSGKLEKYTRKGKKLEGMVQAPPRKPGLDKFAGSAAPLGAGPEKLGGAGLCMLSPATINRSYELRDICLRYEYAS